MYGSALLEECVERFDLIEEQAVVNHVLVIGSQRGQGAFVGYQAKTSGARSVVVDQLAIWALLCEEDAFVIGNRLCQLLVLNRRVGKASRIQASQVEPVASEAVTTTKGTCSQKTWNAVAFSQNVLSARITCGAASGNPTP